MDDASDEHPIETRLKSSEAGLRALAQATSDVLYRMSPDWSEMRELDGGVFLASTTDPSRAWLMNYIPVDERARVTSAIEDAIRGKSPFNLEHGVRRLDGSLGWTLSRAAPVLDGAGEIVEWFGAASDMTLKHDAEQRL